MILRLAWRSIWRNKRRTLITVLSIGMGLAIAIFFIALAEGVYDQMINQVVRMQAGHITLENPQYRAAPSVDLYLEHIAGLRKKLEALSKVERTKIIVLGQGIAKSGSGTVAAAIMGVEPSVEAITSPLVKHITQGSYLEESDRALVVVGSELAKRLNLGVGKKLVISTNDVEGNLVETLCRVKGIFETGSDELDAYFVQATLGFARRLFRIPDDAATQLGVVLRDSDRQKDALKEIRAEVGGASVSVLPWQRVLPELASYIKLDRGSNIVFQAILIFLVLFTILNTILMSVLERQREFAVLLALGTNPFKLRGQLLMESFFLGLIGCLVGLAVGGLSAYLLKVYGFDLRVFLKEGITISGFAMSTRIRAKLSPVVLLAPSVIVFLATLVLSLVPMRRATGVSIVDQLR